MPGSTWPVSLRRIAVAVASARGRAPRPRRASCRCRFPRGAGSRRARNPLRVARRPPPAVGAQRGSKEPARAPGRCALSPHRRLVQMPEGGAEHGRLGDAGGRDPGAASCPTRRAREIVVARGVEDDVRDHPVVPLPLGEALQLAKGAREVEGGEAHGHEGRVPVPLERVEAVRRHRVAAAVVAGEDGAGGLPQVGRAEVVHVQARATARPVAASIQVRRAGSMVRPTRSPAATAGGRRGDDAGALTLDGAREEEVRAHRLDHADLEGNAGPGRAQPASSPRSPSSTSPSVRAGQGRLASPTRAAPPEQRTLMKFMGGLPRKPPTKRVAGVA